jgi:hypothetical protein
LSNKNGNGHGEYDPKVIYRHLGADVWEKIIPDSEQSEVAYTDEADGKALSYFSERAISFFNGTDNPLS